MSNISGSCAAEINENVTGAETQRGGFATDKRLEMVSRHGIKANQAMVTNCPISMLTLSLHWTARVAKSATKGVYFWVSVFICPDRIIRHKCRKFP